MNLEKNKEIEFAELGITAISLKEFYKITFSKPTSQAEKDLKNIYFTPVKHNGKQRLKVLYRYQTRDITKIADFDEMEKMITDLMPELFLHATLLTSQIQGDLRYSKKRIANLTISKITTENKINTEHNESKNYLIDAKKAFYLHDLGLIDDNGNIKPTSQAKFKQLNKFIEIVDNLLKQTELKSEISICDMGSGKGYLTFGLYDYLTNVLKIKCNLIGVEQRKDLVDLCNSIAVKYNFNGLTFQSESIENFNQQNFDVLIALHACDSATDDALFYGLKANAQILVAAPCCHKQIRKEMKNNNSNNPVLKYGIFEERQAEMITDTIRALLLQSKNYEANIFEFISPEHTSKNTMITAVKKIEKIDNSKSITDIKEIKKEFGIKTHYLEELLSEK